MSHRHDKHKSDKHKSDKHKSDTHKSSSHKVDRHKHRSSHDESPRASEESQHQVADKFTIENYQRVASGSLDKNNVLETLTSFFVNIYYNVIFNVAHVNFTKTNKKNATLTDEYRKSVSSFALGVKNDTEQYRNLVRQLPEYFSTYLRGFPNNFNALVDRIVEHFIPEAYFKDVKSEQRDEVLGDVLCDLVSNLCAYVISPEMLRRIVDEHDAKSSVNIGMLQERGKVILQTKSDALHANFLGKGIQAREDISHASIALEKMRHALVRLAKQKHAEKMRADKYEKAYMEEKQKRLIREGKMIKIIKLLKVSSQSGIKAAANYIQQPKVPKRDKLSDYDGALLPLDTEPLPEAENLGDDESGDERNSLDERNSDDKNSLDEDKDDDEEDNEDSDNVEMEKKYASDNAKISRNKTDTAKKTDAIKKTEVAKKADAAKKTPESVKKSENTKKIESTKNQESSKKPEADNSVDDESAEPLKLLDVITNRRGRN